MAIPFLLAGAAVLAGGYGIKKGFDAKEDMDRAQSINEHAKDIANSTERRINNNRKSTSEAIKQLGSTKISIMANTMDSFVENFSRIKNIDFRDSIGLDELRGFDSNSQEFLDMKNASFEAAELTAGGMGAIAAGTLTAAGAYGAAGFIGVASTGTAISALSGAAATNATLAWLGGGALSAGGLGMAGGMAVLGGIVAGPALAIGGAFLASKAEKALNDARSNLDQARKFEQDGENICSVLKAIQNRADQINYLLKDLDDNFSSFIGKMTMIIEMRGNDWRNYRQSDKEEIGITAQLAKTIKIIVDTSLLKENGELDDYQSQKALNAGQKTLAKLNQQWR